ncbi:MAG TPA: integrase arm-type DNA-binding domain-containing protein [Sphingopyxis sp.]|nr:integrase arm-type DNA-binding domain-containing protein [Sphingopyxis sp.]HMP43881.1 integrase arm-type DNA-binding domain-containing protein [Sphingopyxis sp.]HMQ18518.1 integrase arm-type DNA-binding domain-containing protein [Sphingopyxis sp.]
MLTDVACRSALPGERDRKLSDSGSLYLLIKPSGTKSWRWKFRIGGKEKQLVLGRYPAMSLAEARRARDGARALLAEGVDPTVVRKQAKAKARDAALHSFEAAARAWHRDRAATLAPRYARQILERLEENIFREFGSVALGDVTPPMVLAAIRKIEERGAKEMAHRVRLHVSDVFVWAIAAGLAENDPAAIIHKALKKRTKRLRPAFNRIADARALLAASEAASSTSRSTRLASQLMALTAARPGVVRLAEPREFEDLDGDNPLWRIPARKMKLTRERKEDVTFEFVIPLSRQTVAVVKAALATNQRTRWLFPGYGGGRNPISESTVSKHYRDLGYRDRHVPHGWRATFSTIMNERAAIEDRERDRAIIELMLAHIREDVEAAYNRAAYMPRRRELAQAWADMLMPDG